VIVYETDNNKAYISAFDPVSALEAIKSDEMRNIAKDLSEKLKRVIDKISRGQ